MTLMNHLVDPIDILVVETLRLLYLPCTDMLSEAAVMVLTLLRCFTFQALTV